MFDAPCYGAVGDMEMAFAARLYPSLTVVHPISACTHLMRRLAMSDHYAVLDKFPVAAFRLKDRLLNW